MWLQPRAPLRGLGRGPPADVESQGRTMRRRDPLLKLRRPGRRNTPWSSSCCSWDSRADMPGWHTDCMGHDPISTGIFHMARIETLDKARSVWDRILGRHTVTTMQPQWLLGRPFDDIASSLWAEAELAWRRERRFARRWTLLHYSLGLLAVILAAVAGFGGLSDLLGKEATALVALLSGAATAVATFVQSDSKRQLHEQRATAWDSYRDEITTIAIGRPKTPQEGSGPPGWKQVTEALQTRARALRANQPDPLTEPRSWPGTAGEGPSKGDLSALLRSVLDMDGSGIA